MTINRPMLAKYGPWAVAAALLVGLPYSGITFNIETALSLGLIYAIAAVGLDVFMGYAGQLSFGHFGFVACGAYISAIAGDQWSLNPWLALVLAVLGTMLIATLIGIPMVRLPEIGSSLVSFFFAFIVVVLLTGNLLIDITHGSTGIMVTPATLGGIDLNQGEGLYYTALAALGLATLTTSIYVSSRFGKMLRLIRHNPTVATSLGTRVDRAKLVAFVYSAAWCAVSGFLFGQSLGTLIPDAFSPYQSIYLAMIVVLGGLGSVYGPILGALFYAIVTELSFGAGSTSGIVLALVILLVLVLMPTGLRGLLLAAIRTVRKAASSKPPIPAGTLAATGSADANLTVLPHRGGSKETLTTVLPRRGGSKEILTVEALRVSFGGVHALQDVDIAIREGTIHGIVGPNGAGKTTLLNSICGYIRYDGTITFDGTHELSRLHPSRLRRLGIARTFQHPALAKSLTAKENVELGMYAVDVERSADLVAELLTLARIPESLWDVPASQLSLAELKVVDVARALASKPRLLLLDEPTAGLESDEMAVMAGILEAAVTRGTTVLVISHHVGFLQRLADDVTVLDFGKSIASGSFDSVFSDPVVVDAFLGVSVS
ncbi:ATP-binding cassette domain-containing protein [Arthrobacter sp. PAMC25564]|uniref:branched-chain amino acid ABC transporter ATP-binding protein/permease n=1 Tax=Arthrobacter sp. PAMC25564 TaxID=2565366 RepID=UPI0010A1FE27|nr:ATP-binding cassette domain-containing protein [Arthrobacter sp. PAMC25564]QCB97981.1 ATP-binding cassette domain-containing protein [Arthrobacter sp. PAMC25564]